VFNQKLFLTQFKQVLASTVSIAVEHFTLNPMIKCLNPAVGTGSEKCP
jgi:hypothetical protein